MLLLALAHAACPSEDPALRAHLVTVAPGGDLFSSMGHTAIAFTGGELDAPVAFDWGAYDPAEASVPRFLAGELPYFLNRRDLRAWLFEIRLQDRTAGSQELSLPEADARHLLRELERASEPDRRGYAYHWATANCATRARDALDDAFGGALAEAWDRPATTTARDEASRHLHRWPIPAFAWRFATDARLDRPLTVWERAMLPEHLMRALDVTPVGGTPAVSRRCVVHDGAYGWAPPPPPTWPWAIPGLVGSVAVLASALAGRTRAVGGLVALYGSVLGLLGSAAWGVWAMSGTDGIGPHAGALLAGPQSFGLVLAGLGLASRRVTRGLAALGLAGAAWIGLSPTAASHGDIAWALLPGLLACATALELRPVQLQPSTVHVNDAPSP